MGAALRTEGITRSYKNFTLRDISIRLESGYLTGLIGKNGSGKTTLLKILAGQDERFSGSLVIDARTFTRACAALRSRTALVSEQASFFWEKTPIENGRLMGVFFESWDAPLYEEWLCRMKLRADGRLLEFSRGERLKFQLAFAAAHHPRVLLLDEPSTGLDPVFRIDFIACLQQLLEQDTAILLATHITEDLKRAADYLIVLSEGRQIYTGNREDFEKKKMTDLLEEGKRIYEAVGI